MTVLGAAYWSKVRKTDYCWLWQGAQNTKGYGVVAVGGALYLAHRLSYTDAHGPIAPGMTLDHLCRTRNCVNPGPEHLEVVTIAENNRRRRSTTTLDLGDVCVNGHRLTADSIYTHPRGHTECRDCRREKNRTRRQNAKPVTKKEAAA